MLHAARARVNGTADLPSKDENKGWRNARDFQVFYTIEFGD
jgi:hypothetical protein